ncbi:solute carrier family 35 member F5-like [Lytechinus variegatus]|uniref:solute carrier family 35 member F5-like n=1 Tax=Lytechinus variegatus TaxID=7654 RepID=UPI001BB25C25|nr:solute carrier family 35 member F5-like [Lytechinus variegatus]XP_041475603.1 solute carrier family 35 member F5-like [Lytechinus variegatus]
MSLTSGLTRPKRMAVGILLLLVVDVIWVVSSEITQYIFKDIGYDKPFFSTYLKTSMFMLYLLGFLFWRPWRRQCLDCFEKSKTLNIDENSNDDEDVLICSQEHLLSDPLYVPVKFNDSDKESSRSNSFSEPCDSSTLNSRVRFSNLMEVRHLSDDVADEAMMARLSFNATQRAKENLQQANKFTIPQVAKISFMFCLVWFLANFSYQEALNDSQMAIVNTLSSTSGLFTVILAALFPSSQGDKFTLTKLFAVLVSVGGIFMVSYSDRTKDNQFKLGSLWALAGAFFYAVYLVALKRKVDNEDKIDIPMFFGFVGLFNFLVIWPGIVILHYTNIEPFQLPKSNVWIYLAVNGIVGTVLSEFLWLWGCFLTSSLIGTLSLSLTIPMSILVDIYYNNVDFSLMFILGAIPVFVSFIVVAVLTHYNDWDPAWALIKRLYYCFHRLSCLFCTICSICRRKTPHVRLPTSDDKDQSESLIALHSMDGSGNALDCC